MMLKRMKLENFRIFRGVHEFDFTNKKVIVIQGPNGHGKTTFFDALIWVFTGKFNRFMGTNEYQKFNYLLNTKARENEKFDVAVEIELESSDKIVHRIRREYKTNTAKGKVIVNGASFGVKDGLDKILQLILMPNIRDFEKLGDFSSVFSSTQILSQDTLEEFVKVNKPKERYDKLEKILGLDKYGKELKNYIRAAHNIYKEDINVLEKDIQSITNEIDLKSTSLSEKMNFNLSIAEVNESDVITSINEDSRKFNAKTLFLDYLPMLSSLDETEITTLQDIRKDFQLKRRKIIPIHSKIKKNFTKNFNEEDEKLNIRLLENKIKDMQQLQIKRRHGIKKANEKLNNLSALKDKLINIDKITDRINNFKVKVQEIDLFIEYVNSHKLINLIVKNYGGTERFKEYYKDLKLTHQNKVKQIEALEYKEKIDTFEKEIKTYELTKEKFIFNIEDLDSIIKGCEVKIRNLTKKKQSRKDDTFTQITLEIQRHLLDEHDKDSCPVCGTTFETKKEFFAKVAEAYEKGIQHMDSIELDISEEKTKLRVATDKHKENESNLINTKKQLDKLNKELEKNKSSFSYLLAFIDLPLDSLEQQKDELENLDKQINRYKEEIHLIEEKEVKLKDREINLTHLNQQIKIKESLEKEFVGRYKDMNDITKLELKINTIRGYLSAAKNQSDYIVENLKEVYEELQISERKLEILDELRKDISDFWHLSAKSFKEIKYAATEIKYSLEEADSLLEKNLKYITAFKEKDKIVNLENELNKLTHKKSWLEKKKNNLNKSIKGVELFQEVHSNVQNKLINKYLKQHSKTIDLFFQQISPHAYYKYVKLVASNNDLHILLDTHQDWKEFDGSKNQDLTSEINASLNLSAAQATILALSIFLSLNISQDWSKLNLIGIDDPFQHLDDVNTYSFIDVVTSMVETEDKQVILSTHSKDFSDLLISKLNLESDEISKVSIVSYSKDSLEINSKEHILY